MKKLKTKADIAINKNLFFNGKKLSGVQSFHIQYDVTKAITLAHISMAIKNNSFKINGNNIYFEEVANG